MYIRYAVKTFNVNGEYITTRNDVADKHTQLLGLRIFMNNIYNTKIFYTDRSIYYSNQEEYGHCIQIKRDNITYIYVNYYENKVHDEYILDLIEYKTNLHEVSIYMNDPICNILVCNKRQDCYKIIFDEETQKDKIESYGLYKSSLEISNNYKNIHEWYSIDL